MGLWTLEAKIMDDSRWKAVLEQLKEPRARWILGGGAAILALCTAGLVFGSGDRGPRRAPGEGPPVSIAVVAPAEPNVEPGERMDVGVLSNGFDGRPPQSPPVDDADLDVHAEPPAYIEDDRGSRPPMPAPMAHPDKPPVDLPPRREMSSGRDRMEIDQSRPHAFGFDQSQPDWRAERRAREAARDARLAAERSGGEPDSGERRY